MKLIKDGHTVVVDVNGPQHLALIAEGFAVVPDEEIPEANATPDTVKPFEAMNAEELRAEAVALRLPVTDKMGKARLLELLKNAPEASKTEATAEGA